MKKAFTLCADRHATPAKDSIFASEVNPLDLASMQATVVSKLKGLTSIDLYVTGLTVAVVEVIRYCQRNNVSLTLYHYDRVSNSYYPQDVITEHQAFA